MRYTLRLRAISIAALSIIGIGGHAAISPTPKLQSHLKFFGHFGVDCGIASYDGNKRIVNYLQEVSGFSNVGEICPLSSETKLSARLKTFADQKVKGILDVGPVFFRNSGAAASGLNLDLYSDYIERWKKFRTQNADVLTPKFLAAFLPAREPVGSGVTFGELQAITRLVRQDFPQIPIMIVANARGLEHLKIPENVDWLALMYMGTLNPQSDTGYRKAFDRLKELRTSKEQKLVVVAESQWLRNYNRPDLSSMMMKDVATRYFEFANADESVVGILGYSWPSGIKNEHIGLRELPAEVVGEHKRIGQAFQGSVY